MDEETRYYLFEKISDWIEEIVANSSSSDELTKQYVLHQWRKRLSVLLTGSDQQILDLFHSLEYQILGPSGYSSEIKLLWDYSLEIYEQNGIVSRFKGKIVTNLTDDYIKDLNLREKAELLAKLFTHERQLKEKVKDSISTN